MTISNRQTGTRAKKRWTRQRWWLLVKDVNGTVVYNQAFFFRAAAVKYGRAVTTPPLNRYEVVRG